MSVKIDKRDLPQLVEAMTKLAPYYTPEWRFSPEDPDPGTALFYLVAEMIQENTKRLNRVPYKHLAAFLNLLDVRLLTARPSRAHLTFQLTGSVPDPVLIPAGTQVAADPEDGGEELIFETAQPLLVTLATLQASYNITPVLDHIVSLDTPMLVSHKQETGEVATFFATSEALNEQQHILYLGHSFLFDLKHETRIEIDLIHGTKHYQESAMCEQLVNGEYAEWSYYSQGEWIPFDDAVSRGNRIVLHKDRVLAIDTYEVQESETYWIRCMTKPGLKEPIKLHDQIELNGLYVQSEYYGKRERGGILPDRLYYNDLELAPTNFYPFGDIFAPYGTFYVGSKEVLGKRDSWVTLRFHMRFQLNELAAEPEQIDWKLIMKRKDVDKPKPPPIMILKVAWEYWNGDGWVRLFHDEELDTLFYHTEDEERRVRFRCPVDIETTHVNAEMNYWIRVRIVSLENLYGGSLFYMSPYITSIGLFYDYGDRKYPLEACSTYNNIEYKDRTPNVRPGGELFKPFYSLDCEAPAVVFGLDAPPLKGPIGVYFSLQEQKVTSEQLPAVEWEYYARQGGVDKWLQLKTADETEGFTKSGLIRFSGPANFTEAVLFGRSLYWIRAVNRDRKFETAEQPYPLARGVYMNAVSAVQHESIRGEVPEEATHPETGFLLSRTPILDEEIWVDESDHLSEEELAKLTEEDETQVEAHRDSDGQTFKVWVRWRPVDHFEFSTSADRHYVIDRPKGVFHFGNGVIGMAPPNRGADKLKVNYRVGGGRRGNVPAGQIENLQSSLAFVENVVNPEAANGGCEMEPIEDALRRGPQRLRHQHRAVTAEDFEWLAKESHPNLAKVKCLANRNVKMEHEPGCMTIVTLPKQYSEGSEFIEIRKEVEQYLIKRVPINLALPGRVRVIEPAYMEIGVTAVVAVDDMDDVLPVEKEVLEKLERFLHPLQGNHHGTGWDIGQVLHESVFYALLMTSRKVKYVERLYLTVVRREDGARREVSLQEWERIPHGIVISGQHKVIIDVDGK